MKKSKYNVIFEHDGKKFAFNGISCALAEVSNNFLSFLKNIPQIKEALLNEEDKNLLRAMKKGGYILEDDIDELSLIKFRNYSGKFCRDTFFLTIAPTLSCNFSCPYCYEKFKTGFMSDSVKNAICSQIELAAKSKQHISIAWYGGEPTLVPNIINELSQKMILTCEKYNVRYTATMTSNGYLIGNNFIDLMKNCKINSVQITLDGPKDIHNSRRKLTNGEGTFDVLLCNIKQLKVNGIEVSIRVNITKENENYFGHLLDTLVENNLQDCPILMARVVPYDTCLSDVASKCLDDIRWPRKVIEYSALLSGKGFYASKNPYRPIKRTNYCYADNINSFIVDPTGSLYKCWTDLGNTNRSIGNILNFKNENIHSINDISADYIFWSPFDHKECLECKILPLCMGGCPKRGLMKKNVECSPLKYNLIENLKLLCATENVSR